MSIEFTAEFELKRLPPKNIDDERYWCSQLYHENELIVEKITGVRLEAQFKCHDYWILFITTDNPWDNSLHIYAVNSDNTIIDEATFVMTTVSNELENLEVLSPELIKFSFMGDWIIRVFDQPRLMRIAEEYPSPLVLSNVKIKMWGTKSERYGYFSITRQKKLTTASNSRPFRAPGFAKRFFARPFMQKKGAGKRDQSRSDS